MKLPTYAAAIRDTIRELAEARPETVLLAAGDVPVVGLATHHAEGAAGVLGAALGLVLSGRPCVVTLSPAAAALAALERWFHTTPTSRRRQSLMIRVPLDPSGPPLGRLASLPGLQIVAPASAAAAARALREAACSDVPLLFLEDRRLAACRDDDPSAIEDTSTRRPVAPSPRRPVAPSTAIHRPGHDLTLVAASTMTRAALRAALALAELGIEAEVIEPLTLAPLDVEAMARSIWRTHRAIVVDEGTTPLGPALAAAITEAAFDELDAPVEVVRVPPGAPTLAEVLAVGAEAITRHATWLLGLPADTPVVEA